MSTSPVRRVSLNPTTFVEGGLIDDVDVKVLDGRWCYFNYGGKSDSGDALCLGLQLETGSGTPEAKGHEQYFSAGDKEYFRPSTPAEDGSKEGGGFLVPIKDRENMSSSTNAAIFLNSLIGCGYPVTVLEQFHIKDALTGAILHINRMAQPKRQGLVNRQRPGQKEREQTVIHVTKVVYYPPVTGVQNAAAPAGSNGLGAKPATIAANILAGQGAAPQAQQVSVAAPAAAGSLDELCTNTLIELLAENGGTLPKGQLAVKAHQKLVSHPMKTQAVPRIFSDAFLQSAQGIRFDGTNVTLG